MCGALQVVLSRRGLTSGWRLPAMHAGRITTYSLLGLLGGATSAAIANWFPALVTVQGIFALLFALLAGYFTLSLLGIAPPAEVLLSNLTRRWGQAVRRLTQAEPVARSFPALPITVAFGLLWGLLPCGLVIAALLTAFTSNSAWGGAVAMLAFGIGTWPALLVVHWLGGRDVSVLACWARPATALVMLLFGVQMALRGFAAWGWVGHFEVGGVMVW